jgi:hypothetical protein
MNKRIKAGSDIHAGDGGYGIGTKENYDAFVKVRNKSLAAARIRRLAEQAGINMDSFQFSGTPIKHIVDEPSLEKFAELIVKECIGCCEQVISDPVPVSVDTFEQGGIHCMDEIKQHFGVGMSTEDKKTLIKELLGVKE